MTLPCNNEGKMADDSRNGYTAKTVNGVRFEREKRTPPPVLPKPKNGSSSSSDHSRGKLEHRKSAPLQDNGSENKTEKLSVAQLRDTFQAKPPPYHPTGSGIRKPLHRSVIATSSLGPQSDLLQRQRFGGVKVIDFSAPVQGDAEDKGPHVPLQSLTKGRPKMTGRRPPCRSLEVASETATATAVAAETLRNYDVRFGNLSSTRNQPRESASVNKSGVEACSVPDGSVEKLYDVTFLNRMRVRQSNESTSQRPLKEDKCDSSASNLNRPQNKDNVGEVYRPRGKLAEVFV